MTSRVTETNSLPTRALRQLSPGPKGVMRDPAEPLWSKIARRGTFIIGVIAVLYFFVFPLVGLIISAFRTQPFGAQSTWTLSGFENVFASPTLLSSIGTSVVYSAGTGIIALVLGVFFAVMASRVDVPLRRFITPIMIGLAVVPTLFYAMAWNMAGSPGGGVVSKVVQAIVGDPTLKAFDVHNWGGLILISAMKVSGLAYMLLLGPIRAADRSLEDAAVMSGSSRVRAFMSITLPSLAPALYAVGALLFVAGLETFEFPTMLGRPAGIFPLSLSIYDYINAGITPDYASASVMSIVFVLLIGVVVLLQEKLLGKRDYAVVGGKALAQSLIRPRGWVRAIVAIVIAVFGLIAIVLPLLQMVLGSFQGFFGNFDSWTLKHYEAIFSQKGVMTAIGSTLLIALLGGALATLIAFAMTYFTIRRKGTVIAGVLRLGSWVPMAAPGIVLSLALLWTYLNTPGFRELFNTPWLMLFALVVAGVPIAARSVEGAVVQIRAELEEANRISGGRIWHSFITITGRLILPSLLSAWLLVGLAMSGRLDVPLLLTTAKSQTIPTLVFSMNENANVAGAAAVYTAFMLLLGAIIAVGWALLAIVRRIAKRAGIASEGTR